MSTLPEGRRESDGRAPARLLARLLDGRFDAGRYHASRMAATNRAALIDPVVADLVDAYVDLHVAITMRLLDAHPEEVEFRAEFEAYQIRHGGLIREAEAVLHGS